ncbi:hypothetical protein DXG03_000902, partial [Asterophora parasitica]
IVYLARSPTGALIALKKQHVTRHVANLMLRHEACAMVLLKGHPSIPYVDAWGRSQYYEYLTMQLLGPTLAKSFGKGKRLDIPSAARAAEQMLDVLSHIHGSIIHSDIKPGNILFGAENDSSGRFYFVDFGFASYYRDLVHLPMETDRKFMGTSYYASLNVHRRHTLARRDDMESLAYTLLDLEGARFPQRQYVTWA